MKVFGLVAFGPLAGFTSQGSIHSRRLFHDAKQAEGAKPEFEKICLGSPERPSPNDLASITHITLIEYELADPPRYTKKFDGIGDLMPVEEFLESCRSGFFIDYDGFGFPARDCMVDESTRIQPSTRHKLPADATHVVWINR